MSEEGRSEDKREELDSELIRAEIESAREATERFRGKASELVEGLKAHDPAHFERVLRCRESQPWHFTPALPATAP